MHRLDPLIDLLENADLYSYNYVFDNNTSFLSICFSMRDDSGKITTIPEWWIKLDSKGGLHYIRCNNAITAFRGVLTYTNFVRDVIVTLIEDKLGIELDNLWKEPIHD